LAAIREDLTGVKAMVFDVFGTLVRMRDPRRPFRKLLEKLYLKGLAPQPDDGSRLMSSNVGLAGVPKFFGVDLPAAEISPFELDLYAELSTIELFPEVLSTLTALRDAGYKLALCSNLAMPYAIPVKLLLPPLDAYGWSFEIGAVKPNPVIYQEVCRRLDCLPNEVLMVGDNLEKDCQAPCRYGIHGFHLVREEDSPAGDAIRTLDELLGLLGLGY
jgi:FMN phosphatase YigB (HAD superfamily)